MRIAVDAMGGDEAPFVNVSGSIQAVKEDSDIDIVLTGNEDSIKDCFKQMDLKHDNFEIVNASQTVEAHEKPTDAFRKKKDSSISVGLRMLKEKKVDAFVSAGNTGAVVAFSIFTLGRLKGVLRPALASFFPTLSGCCLVLDVGATSDTKAINLLQYAIMGSIYYQKIVGKENPRIGLLSIGEESTKGKGLTYQAFQMIEKSGLNFTGNIEGNDILKGKADVVVADGFAGNAILKFGESIVNIILDGFRNAVKGNLRYKLGGMLLKPAIKKLFKRMNYEEYGGAALLGVDGITLISHGRSNARAIKSAILAAQKDAREKVNEIISQKLKGINMEGNSG